MPAEFADELRDAVFLLRDLGRPTTLTGLIVDSCERRLAELVAEISGPIPGRGDQTLLPGPLAPNPSSPATTSSSG